MSHRVNATIPDDVYGVLKRYAEVMGTTPSTVLRDFIVEMVPALAAVVDAMVFAEGNKKKALVDIQSVLLENLSNASSLSCDVQKEIQGL